MPLRHTLHQLRVNIAICLHENQLVRVHVETKVHPIPEVVGWVGRLLAVVSSPEYVHGGEHRIDLVTLRLDEPGHPDFAVDL